MPLKWIPRSKSGASKSRRRWAAHSGIGNVWEYPLPPQGTCSKRVPSRFGLSTPFQLPDETTTKIIYANVYRNTINDGDSQTSLLPIFSEGGGTSVHRLNTCLTTAPDNISSLSVR